MATSVTIRKTMPAAGLDYERLRGLMQKHAQSLARNVWTDFNIHDPGVTTIEVLCYALTDLSYRASFPVEDLLRDKEGPPEGKSQAFFTAREILPNRALTFLDYRKLLIDLRGIKNAWLKPAALRYFADPVQAKLLRADPGTPGIRPVDIRGLHQVLLECDEEISDDEKQKAIADARQKLHDNRNLCEDFVSFDVVKTHPFMLCAELELAPEADTAIVQAQILFQVQHYLAPPVPIYSRNEMLERKHADGSPLTVDEIFEGPALECGFIDDAELAGAELRKVIRLSDIISIIMDIPGVQAVREIVINPTGTKLPLENKWILTVDDQKKALLDRARSRLVFYKKNTPVTPDPKKVEGHYAELVARQRAKSDTSKAKDLDIPAGTFRDPGNYYSFQNHFPGVYGLSEAGLASDADEKRKALALQFKAYLLLFDQVLANYLAQLSRVRELFSINPLKRKTYFWQGAESFSIADCETICPKAERDEKTMDGMVEDEGSRDARRNRFLDHLIARFAEHFHEYVSVMGSAFGAGPNSAIETKCQFLAEYPVISSERALAYNLLRGKPSERWNSKNVSGLEKRIARLLGIANFSRRNLTEIVLDENSKAEANDHGAFLFRLVNGAGKILLTSSTDFPSEDEARQELKRALHYARQPGAYDRKTASDGKFFFNLLDSSGKLVARRSKLFETAAQRDAAILEAMKFTETHYPEEDEGMLLIENLLLRPASPEDPFLPICVDPNCTDCADDDPYSYRLHIVLPAYAGRFRKMDFRRFVEEVIREETPAHILPKICWVDWEDMRKLETVYREWLELDLAAPLPQKKEKLAALMDTLFQVKNVYPSNKLHECAAGDEQPKFLLGQTALGSEKKKDS